MELVSLHLIKIKPSLELHFFLVFKHETVGESCMTPHIEMSTKIGQRPKQILKHNKAFVITLTLK